MTSLVVPKNDLTALPGFFDRAHDAIDQARSPEEINSVMAAVSAAVTYVKEIAKGNEDLIRRARALDASAQLRLGQLCGELPKSAGAAAPSEKTNATSHLNRVGSEQRPASYAELGIDPNRAFRAQQFARLPAETLTRALSGEITVSRAIATHKEQAKSQPDLRPASPAAETARRESALDRARAENAKLKAELAAMTERAESLDMELTNAQDAIHTLQDELANYQAIKAGTEAQRLESIAQKWRDVERDKNGLMNANADLKKRYASLERAFERYKRTGR